MARSIVDIARGASPNGQHHPTPPRPPAAPRPPSVPAWEPFPVDALPPVLKTMVEQTAASVGCDPAFAVLPGLVVSAAAAGGAIAVKAKRKYVQPPSLYGVTVAESGTGKTPAEQAFTTLAYEIEHELADHHRVMLTQYEKALAAPPDPALGGDKPRVPVREYFVCGDTTVERLIENLDSSPRGVLVHQDELAAWFGSFARYRGKGGGSDAPHWLKFFDGSPIPYQRRGGQPREVYLRRPIVSVIGGIQPGILRKILGDESHIEGGMAARFLFVMPPRQWPKLSEAEIDPDAERKMLDVIARLRIVPFDAPNRKPAIVDLTPAARRLFDNYDRSLASEWERMDEGPLTAALSKLARLGLRLALVHHCVATAAAGEDPTHHPVGERSMAAAVTMGTWFFREAKRVYAMLGESSDERDARRLTELIRRKGGRCTPRDLQRTNNPQYRTREASEAALESLVGLGWGEWEVKTVPTGGWPVRTFVLNSTHDTRPDEDGPDEGGHSTLDFPRHSEPLDS